MIHYHGTPIGGSREQAARFLVGRHALVSFFRPDDLPIVMDVCQSFVLDNGAFSHWKSGKGDINFNKYTDWVSTVFRHPNFDWALIPDKIDGDEDQNSKLVLDWVRLGMKAKGVPIWHLHESLDYLDYLINNFEWVAFGSSGSYSQPNTKKWWDRMAEAMSIACDDKGRPKAKLHGLRMLDPDIFTRLPFSSADSTNAAVNSGSLSRFGMYKPPTVSQRAEVIAERIECNNSSPIFIKQSQLNFFD